MRKLLALLLALVVLLPVTASASTLTADANAPKVEMSDTLYGLFFEDINYGADGGLYAELLQNRSFEYEDILNPQSYQHLNGWQFNLSYSAKGKAKVMQENPLHENNPNYVRVTCTEGEYRFANVGFQASAISGGIPVEEGKTYNCYVWMRNAGDFDGKVEVALSLRSGKSLAVPKRFELTEEWQKYELTFTSSYTENAVLAFVMHGTGSIDIDMASLIPADSFGADWLNGGLRPDLVQALADLHPRFLRFPGGCIVEGRSYDNMYRFRETLGPVEDRRTNWNRWQMDEYQKEGRSSADYFQTYGLGFYEFFLLCEDLGCEAIPCLNSGISCYGPEYEPMADLQPWIDDAIDLIEFATGDPETNEWAALRAEMGHPEPFPLTYLEIGNEQAGDERYYERFEEFERQIHALYPEIKLLSSVIGLSNGAGLPTTEWLRGKGRDFVYANDEHFYMSDEWFLTNAYRYDAMERGEDAYIFAGEYACHYSGNNPLWNAVCEAAFMTGFERNADIVKLSCYAPLFSKVNYTQWQPNLIIFNNQDVWGTPSYWVDYLYGTNVGDVTLADSVAPTEAAAAPAVTGKVGLATWNTRAEYDDLKVVDTATGEVLYENSFDDGDLSGWTDGQNGRWAVREGMLYQSNGNSSDNAIHVGDTAWRDYTVTLRARKLAGGEGFIIPFLVQDRLNYYHLNLGGWNNTYSAIERAVNGGKSLAGTSDFVVETNRWYDIRIEVDQTTMKCYVDGEMIISSAIPQSQPVYVTSSRDAETGDIILKVVNATESVNRVQILLENAGEAYLNPSADAWVLTGERRNAANSARNPEKVAPVKTVLTGVGADFTYEAPANSVSVIRVHTRPDGEVLRAQTVIEMRTGVGQAIELPETVEVTFADGTTGAKAVTWDHVEASVFDWAGTYEIFGSVDGRADMVKVVLTVE